MLITISKHVWDCIVTLTKKMGQKVTKKNGHFSQGPTFFFAVFSTDIGRYGFSTSNYAKMVYVTFICNKKKIFFWGHPKCRSKKFKSDRGNLVTTHPKIDILKRNLDVAPYNRCLYAFKMRFTSYPSLLGGGSLWSVY